MADTATTTAPRPVADHENVVPARSRGRLTLERKAVERIAAQAASESDSGRTGGVSGGFLGLGAQSDLTAKPATTVELVGQTATVSVEVTVAYPAPIRQATDAIRRQVMDRVHQLTGVQVTRVDITVSALKAADTQPSREVR